MYLIINKTQNIIIQHQGSFPDMDNDLNNGDKIIIISLYSNTIKVPYSTELNGIIEWKWEDFNLPRLSN